MFGDKMVTPAIPERIFALCKIVEKNPISSADLKEKMYDQLITSRLVNPHRGTRIDSHF